MSLSILRPIWRTLLAIALAGCAGGPQLPQLPVAGKAGAGPSLSVGSLPVGEASRLDLPSAEVYSRIARGANACWFGPNGRLASSHILHADAAPSMSGGAVEIVVHERAVDQPKPWGYKAYRITLTESAGIDGTPGGGGTSIEAENLRLPDAEAHRMRSEVFQWASGTQGCVSDPALDKPKGPTVAAPAQPPAKKAQAKAAAAK